jgi:Cu2+-exporting ATPase
MPARPWRVLQALGLRLQVASGDAPGRRSRRRARTWHPRLGIAPAAAGQARAAARLQADGHRVLAVGDGLNDAPLLAGANVAAAIGSGSALAQRSADLLLTGERLAPLVDALHPGAARARIMHQNLAWAALYNLARSRSPPAAAIAPGWARAGHGRLFARRDAQCLARRPRPRRGMNICWR